MKVTCQVSGVTCQASRLTLHASQFTPYFAWEAIAFYLMLITILLAACAPPSSDEPQPPEIAYGQDVCDACGMVIDQPKFAAATLLKNGATRKFDDIGDMIAYHMDHPDQQVAAYFAHDYATEKWLRAEKAFFVMDKRIQSPMGHGLVVFGNEAAAEEFAATLGATVISFDEVRAQMHMKEHG